ncbi:ubiquitin-protein ligase, putative [Ricinus communis]|uniref:Auxin transport protein BIG n=1 Tax=Ricinus communis TaxID=3988 RepID=B9SIX2_RICCO|nr:ubiquitin-protein ligase, putative [Ricinus communis]
MHDEKVEVSDYFRRLSFGLRILKLLRTLIKDIPYVGYDASLLQAVASCVDVLPCLFRIRFEFANNHAYVEGSLEGLILLLLEEFLLFVRVAFCNSNACQNIQVCIVASVLDNLDSSIWRYNNPATNSQPPLIYFPRSVLYILKRIQDLKRQTFQALDMKGFDTDLIGSSADLQDIYPSCHVHSMEVPLLKRFKHEDLLKIIFAPSTQWMDNLMHLLFFLHREGLKIRPKVDRSLSNCSKVNPSEVENAVCHEDEALFGNLFYEGSRSVGSTDGFEQPPASVNSCSSNCNLPIQAASELLNFLKENVFSHEWSPPLFEDACKRLKEDHIDILLSVLSSQGFRLEDKSSDRCSASHEERKTGHINGICFELLLNLLTSCALPDNLEEYLIEQILNVEDDTFVYNDQTLTLLSHTLSSRVGLAGSQLRTKLFKGYVGFIVDKAKAVCSNCPSIKEVVGTLPSLFHIEILVMAFHLSSEQEKAALANLIFSSIRAVDAPSSGFSNTQLSCWALVVSRLILVLRHMLFYPHNCPSSLLLDLRSKLREAPVCGSILPHSVNEQMSSWAFIAAKTVMGGCIEAEPTISALINQLYDISALPPSLCRDELAVESLCLSWNDLCAALSWILGLWTGRKALSVADLIVERYMFSLCLDIPISSSTSDHQLSIWSETESMGISNMVNFFHFSHSLVAHTDDIGKGMNLPNVVLGVLQHLSELYMPEDIEELGLDFLRNGFWLSMVISLLNVGICHYCIKNSIPGACPSWIENTARDNAYITIAEGLTSSLNESGQVLLLLGFLSSLLTRYIQAYQKAFLATVADGQCTAVGFSSLLLLKHSSFDNCLQDGLLKKSGISSYHLESFSDILSKWDAVIDKRAPSVRCKVFCESMLHGFPSHLQTPSAILLSSILSIRGIVFVLDGLFRIEDMKMNIFKERKVLCQILNSVMTIKFDRIFESIQGKCVAIVRNLSVGFELPDYSDLFLLKHMEGFLREINASEECDSNSLEWPRKFTGNDSAPIRSASNFQSFLSFTDDADQLPDSDSDLDEDLSLDTNSSLRLSIPRELQDGIKALLGELDIEGCVLQLCSSLLPSITSKRESNISKDKKIVLGKDKVLSYSVELLQLKKAYKGGSLDLKIKADYPNAKELRTHLASGSLVKSLLSVSNRGRLAVGEGDKVAVFDVGQLIGQATIAPVTADKTNVKPLSRNVVRFEIVHLVFNSVVENYLAIAGYEDCQVLTLNPRGEVTDRLPIELALQGAYIRRIDWVPGSQVKLMVVTNRFIKIYDLSQDNISPLHYFTLPDDMIVDATLLVASQGRMFLIVLSEQGSLFRLELSVQGNVGATPLKEIIQIKDREMNAKGSSLYFSATYKLLIISYQDGTTLMGRLSSDATSLTDMSFVYEDEQDGKMHSAGLHRWRELLIGSGLFVCFSSVKSNAALAVSMGPQELHAQSMRHAVSSTSHLVGLTAYKPLSKDKVHCLVLHDDGSLQIYSYIPAGSDASASLTADKVKKLGSGILNSKAYAGVKPEFPLDFFEKTVCITADVKLGGDAIRNGDSEAAKQSLASEDGFLESATPAGFKISASNSNPDIVMVGFRVHVGNSSANHIPSDITIFQRVIKLDEGMRSWYDIPFTVAESLLADEEFVISVGPTFNGTALPRIDSLEIYGRAKDEFGWKEKMDDMEAHVLGSNSLLGGSGKKCRSLQSASIQEQVVADGLKLLSKLYSLCRSQDEDAKTDPSELECKLLLETIFESDREPLLQAAACHVLQSVFPKKDIYYQVKDSMRLHGVVKSTSMLSSRLGVGGTTGGWIVAEFTAQMRAVSKIALHRRSNLALFLELNGSEVVDGLMQVLWGILEFEQPDTQTMNNIVIASVELIYCYAECLALHGKDTAGRSVAPAVALLKKLLFSPSEAVQTSSRLYLAIASRLLQVPFPKQTMLATDDAADSGISAAGAAETTGGNTQVLIEEDSITSSVQYCCDGCSTVPILRRRWHCTVCPDFDLCEACYQVLDADRLPPPHSRDHPMTAIPIEVESLGGDGNEIHFTTDDANGSNLMPITADVSMQNSTPSIHVLEPNESGDFAASVTDAVSISASKRAVNSLLLSELLEHLKGWMQTTSGVRAIPVMQLFYRLSSAVGGPFIDSSKPEASDLEKLIRWFLDEIDLNRPFVAKNRNSFGEVAILLFMFFTLMLRNWHQPGGDGSILKSSGSTDSHDKNVIQATSIASHSSLDGQEKSDFTSQLLRACSTLRNQAFVNYLMDILQQLVNLFKSPTTSFETAHGLHAGSGCGALLTVRRDLPAGNFSPFFSDSYAKAHRTDIFMDYHRLLLENAFRLVYTLVRPEKQDKTGEKEKVYKISSGKDLKLEGYQDVLCSYINNPHTTFVRRYARRLFLHLCGSKTHYYSVRDSWQFSTEMKKLYKHINKSGGLQNPVPYERSVKIVKCLSTMAEVAAARPRNWQKYCLRHGDVLPFLMNALFYFGEESVFQTLKLLNLAFYSGKDMTHSLQKLEAGDSGTSSNKLGGQSPDSKKKKKGEEGGTDSGLEKSYLDMETAVDIFADKGGDVLRQFVDCFLLEWNSSSVRMEAKCVLYGAWHHGKHSFKETMLMALLHKVKNLPMYGQNIVEFTELVNWLLGKVPDNSLKQQSTEIVDRCLTPDVIRCIFETLHSQNELIANHPNSRIYSTLSGLVEFDGYYLESEPCVACSSPEVPYSKMKLESLKSETKFTDNRIIVKCTGSYTIQTVTMNVHDARKSKSVKVLNLYYNNRPVADLSELKNNWSLWKRAKSCHLAFNQTELKVEFPIPITACNFMIELDSFYENLQALSLEPLQCPRCSRPVTDKHGICSNCHENAYQCRQCRNINYENLDSFLCNECGYSKYGRFEFNFMAKPSFTFDNMENDDDMKRGLAAIESESENAHRRYQQLLGFKKPLLKIVSSIGENEMDSQQKDSVQQMMVSLPGPSCKINRKIALLGVLYGEKCKAAFDSVSKSVQTLQGLRRVLMSYLHHKHSDDAIAASRFVVSRSPNNCYGCATTFVTQCLEMLQVLSKHPKSKKQLVAAGILSELFENNIHQGPKTARVQARTVLCSFSEGDINAVTELNNLIQKKVMYCLEHHRSMDTAVATREELLLLSEVCSLADEFWESRLRVVFQLLFSSIKLGAKHPAIAEHIILPCLRIISQACTPPKPDSVDKDQGIGKPPPAAQIKDENNSNTSGSLSGVVSGSKSGSDGLEKNWDASQRTQDIQLLSYSEWEKGASYLDFVRRQYKVSQAVKGAGQRSRPQRHEYLALKYALRWRRRASKTSKGDLSTFELGSWVTELVLSACSQSIRSEMCMLISLLCAQSSSRRFRLLNLLMALLPSTLAAGESAAEYFELLFKMIDSEDARLFLTVRGCLTTICKLITQEIGNVESLERSLHIDISQGFILHKLIELLGKFLEVPNIRSRFMRDNLLSDILEALIVIRGLIVQKTKLISDCNRLLNDLLDSLLVESSENKRQFIRACISGLQIHGKERKGRTCLFILEQLCNLICPSKPESVYLLILNKAHTQEEFIRGSMTKSPYSSSEIGPLMRDVKNKICHQLDLLGLLEDDYGMELLVAGNIISLDLSIAQVYEQVWKKSNNQSSNAMANSTLLSSSGMPSARDCPPMTVTYRLQGLDGEATEPMIKELEEDREESQDPEVEFAISGAVREYGGLEILLGMIQRLRDDFKSNQEQLVAVLNLLMHCCKIRENRRALLRLGALGLLLETARRAFSVDAMEPAEGILLIVESLTLEANESDNISVAHNALTVTSEETGTGEQAKKIVLMFLERLCHPSGLKKSNKQQRNTEMVARILPYLTYGEPAAMEALIQHFNPYLQDWREFDRLQKQHQENPKDENIAHKAAEQRFTVENFVLVSESLKTSSCGERLKDIIMEKGIIDVAVRHLRESFAVAGQAGFKSREEWSSGLKLPSVPHLLSMLRGLSMGHLATQNCIDQGGILPLLHTLEGVSGENEIGARAENLLDTLSNKEGKGDGFLEEKVRKLRHATRDEMRQRALRKREELLQGLGMRRELASDGGERIVVAWPVLEGLEDVEEEEDGLACMVCREGYSLRPTDLLGVYSYSKRVNLGVGTSGSARGECVYTTVSYFNIIHFQCHQEAKRADAALRNPKKEWEGATLRNNESLCNSLFPVRGPSVPLAQYIRYIDQYWDNLNALGRADGSRLRLLTYDIVLMLARFATGASFSAESRGGGRESNSRFLPFMIQMARHLLEQGSPSQLRSMAKTVSSYIASSSLDSRPSLGIQPAPGTEETVQFMMVNSLLSESYESWLQHRRSFLQRGIYHAYMQHTHGRSTARASSTSTGIGRMESGSISRSPMSETGGADELLSIVRPMLVYTGLIEQLQRFFKVKKSPNTPPVKAEGSSARSEGEDENGNLEGWEVTMKERLLNVREMVGFSKELLSWLDEMNSSTDLQEAFDIIGVLADVLSGGTSQCEDFVHAAISGGKS